MPKTASKLSHLIRLTSARHWSAASTRAARSPPARLHARLLLEFRSRKRFQNRMMGSERLVSIINSQTNSPGAVQQVSVGNFSQQADVQQQEPLGPRAALLGKR